MRSFTTLQNKASAQTLPSKNNIGAPISDEMGKRIILHLDFDSFFASCEQEFNPAFRGKPVGVTATNGRNCIIAASVEAKKAGIPAPYTVWEAKKICPDIIITPAHFEEYWEISLKFVDICKNFTPFMETFSIDEVFLDITQTHHLFGGPYETIKKIKQKIKKEIGEFITASAGISYNKLLAKLASGINKPNGLFEINYHNREEIYKKVPLAKICGIGGRILFRLQSLGIYTLEDLRETPLPYLVQEFGNVEGNFLKNVGLGIDNSPLNLYTDPDDTKSVGRQYCLPENEYDQKRILQNIFELCEEISIKLRKLHKRAKRVSLYLGGHRAEHGAVTRQGYTNSGKEIFKACKYLYDKWKWGRYEESGKETCPEYARGMVRRIGISASFLEDTLATQLSFFQDEWKQHKILKAIDHVNDKFGDHTIRNGFLLHADQLTTKPNGFIHQ